MNGNEHIQFLATSEDRVALLQRIVAGAKAPSELRDDSDLCRRSIQRNLSEFSSRGWVRRENGKYDVTPTGALILEEFLETRAKISSIDLLAEVANVLPDAVELPSFERVKNVRQVKRSPDEPYEPINFAIEEVECCGGEFVCGRLPGHDTLLRTWLPEVLPKADSVQTTDVETSRNEPAPELGLIVLSEKTLMICYEDREVETVLASSDDCFVKWGETVVESLG